MKSRPMIWLAGVLALFVISCCLPAFRFSVPPFGDGSGEPVLGYDALTAIPFVCYYPAWYANVLFFLGFGLAVFRQFRIAQVYGVLATLLAGIHIVPNVYGIGTLYAGYFCWLGSMAALGLVCRRAVTTGAAKG
jgi:hypothetical protein